jgi:ubiquinone/menaquinone biosynthesis C-methylase UbiE
MADLSPEFKAIKDRMKAGWMAGDFGVVAKFIEAEAEAFVARRPIQPGMRVLDVACGTGNSAIPAARAGAVVTGVDIATNLLEQGRARADQAGVRVQFDEGDAEELPYPDASFDFVITMFGAMFAPRAERAAAELIRVCRPGGQIAMANWTPTGFVGKQFRMLAVHVPPSPLVPPSVLWGDEATVRQRLRDGIADLRATRITTRFVFPFSIPETVDFFRRYFGPTQKAFEALPEERHPALRRDMEALYEEHNTATDGTVNVAAEYLEVVATRG